MWRKLWPTPVRSLVLFLVWLMLNNSVAVIHLLAGVLLAWMIPLLTRQFRLVQPALHRPGLALRYGLMVLLDIVVANIQVLRLVLGPNRHLKPGFVLYPIQLENDLAITILAGTVSLTPGTVSADLVSQDEGQGPVRYLLLHVLDLTDEVALIQQIHQRYELSLKEMF